MYSNITGYKYQVFWVSLYGQKRSKNNQWTQVMDGYRSGRDVFSMELLVKNGYWGIQIDPILEI